MAVAASEKNRRFYLLIAGQAAVFIGILMLTGLAASRMSGGLGVLLAVAGGVCLGLAVLLGKALATDWLSLRVLRRALVRDPGDFRPGEVVAFSGIARTEGEALTAPFSGRRCCAYTYLVAGRRAAVNSNSSTRRAHSLQGFALAPTVIEGEAMTLRLRAVPEVETELRDAQTGGAWGEAAHARVRAATEDQRSSEREGFGSLLVARAGPVEAGRRDAFYGSYGGPDELTVEEEYVPVDEPICLIGTAEADPPGVSGRRARPGPNLVVYRGTPEEVTTRVTAEFAGWLKALWWLLVIAALGLLPGLLPLRWSAAIPGIRSLVGQG